MRYDPTPVRDRRRGLPGARRRVARARRTRPSYDAWAWLVWGRELAGFRLDTSSGPSFKPLPVAIAALLSPAGDAAPALWLVIVRASWLLSLVLAGALAYRLTAGLDRRLRWIAAGFAALVLLLLFDEITPWARQAAIGMSEPLLVALVLGAVAAALDGRSRTALVLAGLAALVRPEAWPLLAAYGVWRWRAEPALRPWIAAIAVAVPALWFAPDLLASQAPPARASARCAATTRRSGRSPRCSAGRRRCRSPSSGRSRRSRPGEPPPRRTLARNVHMRDVSRHTSCSRSARWAGSRSSPSWPRRASPACRASWRRRSPSPACSRASGSRSCSRAARRRASLAALAAAVAVVTLAQLPGRDRRRRRRPRRQRRGGAPQRPPARPRERDRARPAAALRQARDELRARAHRARVAARRAAVAGRELRRAAGALRRVRRRARSIAPPCGCDSARRGTLLGERGEWRVYSLSCSPMAVASSSRSAGVSGARR